MRLPRLELAVVEVSRVDRSVVVDAAKVRIDAV